MSVSETSLLGDHIWREELPWVVHTSVHAPGQDGVVLSLCILSEYWQWCKYKQSVAQLT